MRDVLFEPIVGAVHTVLDLRMKQHALTATNLANSDTPGFKAKVINFEELLPRVIADMDRAAMEQTDDGHLTGRGSAVNPDIEELEAPPWSVDGNSVEPEREAARLSSNAMMYTGLTRGLSKRLAILKFAATNGR